LLTSESVVSVPSESATRIPLEPAPETCSAGMRDWRMTFFTFRSVIRVGTFTPSFDGDVVQIRRPNV
jgi:hypothetical protein